MNKSVNSFRHIPQLVPFLQSLRRIDPGNNEYNALVVDIERSFLTSDGVHGQIEPKLIWYKEIDNFSIDTFRNVIKKTFGGVNHKYSDDLADSFLLLYTYFRNDSEVIPVVEEIFSSIQTISLSQYYLLPANITDGFKGFQFGDFTFGELDEKKFEYRCKRATSDYFDRYQNKLKNRICIDRAFHNVNIIAWHSLADKYSMHDAGFSAALLIYFEKLSEIMFQDFWISFTEQQSLQIAFGIPYIDVERFSRLVNAEKVSIYSKISAFNRMVGYVVPTLQASFNVSVPYLLNDKIQEVNLALKNEFGFIDFADSEFHKTIQSFTRFNAKAYIHFYDNRINEAFLHFVIALDLLLGDKGESTQTVSNRTAILTYLTFNVSFQDQKKTIQKIYDARSKYVHNGEDVNILLLKSLMEVCRIILDILFYMQSQPDNEKAIFHKWIKKLDYVVASYDAGIIISNDELKEIGIYKKERPIINEI
ncbi:hypothetical protein CJD36_000665 [Flavipsychrobacter stenotrophus]|uniref:Uncharacterized protein n=1 Tax=Flavipsychrobacter stenotrophus TaxID=2077091 RepID=A0A2S7SZC7_9BACT|nr:HEPN domain-containing protein [Flavipsychrobacter stenotrophus]PQJ12303.1 hypothetical protein CJD36_000665 [Flavipsychrobacter stenotrophus]